ncbi:uncharacterized protein LOC115411292 isoform X2 [Sphaeramia orbicularis]|uniref:uncharacterized protein LOC115411292 isoform X2 n=1 Tax=Sphaeramia orbicularis TaxID=375764 RepID=UPI00117EE587|nr:uncharacterized protein LOC115411292 isoform X2 [Sphaeramia orbicularis]XP_029979236.1 uncharacterized protein LOC115411292 isoform X2 [Sphaeramia orbicularis]
MSAIAILRRNKTGIQLILSADPHLLIQKLLEEHLITLRQHRNLKLNKTSEELVTEVLDLIQTKGETMCRRFLELLRTDEDLKAAFPGLQETLRDYVELKTRDERKKMNLLSVLEKLDDEEFKEFKGKLKEEPMFRWFRVEKAERTDVVDLMMDSYGGSGSRMETRKVLEDMNRTDLVQRLTEIYSEPGGEGGPKTQTPEESKEMNLLSVLKELEDEAFKEFKRRLYEDPTFPRFQQIKAERTDVINLMMDRYGGSVSRRVLVDMNRTDLVQRLTEIYSEPGEGGPKTQTPEERHKMNLLSVLEELKDEEFKMFKRKLYEDPMFQWSRLEKVERTDVVDLMMDSYGGAITWMETRRVLEDIKRTDLVQRLTKIYSEPGGEGGPKTQTPEETQRPMETREPYHSLRDRFVSYIRRVELLSHSASRSWSTNMERILQDFLDSLTQDQFDEFKQHLKDGDVFMRESNLETASRRNTVKIMFQMCGASGAMKNTGGVLKKMGRIDLVQRLSKLCSTLEGPSTSDPFASDPSIPGPSTSGMSTPSLTPSDMSISEPSTPSPSTSDKNLRVCEDVTEDCVDEDDEMNPHGTEKQQFVCTEAQAGPSDWEEFTPEDSAESGTTMYRFRCPRSGSFHCTRTGLVFVVHKEAGLQYRTVQWDEDLLESASRTPAGPLFSIECPDNAVRQLHFPHCEIEPAPICENLLSIAHITNHGMSFIDALEITDTHVVIDVPHLSSFGVSSRHRRGTRQVRGQVLLFLTPPNTLEMHLLSINVNVDDVKAFVKKEEPRAMYLRVPASCKLITEHKYSVDCCYEDEQIHYKEKVFDLNFGPNYHMMFEIRLPPTTTEVSLTVKDQNNTEVWNHNMNLPAPAAFKRPQQDLPPKKKLLSVGRRQWRQQLCRRRKIGGKYKRKTKRQLLSVLEDLGHSEFEIFKWFLNQKKLGDISPIGKQQLENATAVRVVDLMVQRYEESGAVEVTRRVLKNMNMNELRKKLRNLH